MASRRQALGAAASSTAGLPQPAAVGGSKRRPRSAIAWSCLGFAVGTLFWSATGYAPSLRYAMPGSAPDHTGSVLATAPAKPSDRLPAFPSSRPEEPVRANCVALVLDRMSQQTRPDHCPVDDTQLQFAHSSGRQDRLRPLE